MKIAPIAAALAAVIAAGSLATPSFAQDYRGGYAYGGDGYGYACRQVKRDQTTAGGLFGAIAGAVLGGAVASHDDRGGGALIGAVAGAAVGGSIGHESARGSAECQAARQVSYQRSYRAYDGVGYGYGDAYGFSDGYGGAYGPSDGYGDYGR